MSATFTERYISAVTTSLDAAARQDVRDELEASITDAVEARVAQGEDPAVAERAVLSELGDPAALAASYAERPLHLIGPKYYLTWWRLLVLLLWIVPPVAVVGVIIASAIADAPIGDIIGQAISVGITAALHVAFWTTLVFVILERSGADTGVRWSVDALAEVSDDGAGRKDLIASLVFLGILAGALVWDRFVGFVRFARGEVDVSAGLGAQTESMPVLHPDLWPWWISAALALIVLEALLAVAVYARRGWRPGFAAANSVLAVVMAAGIIFLAVTGQLINPELLEVTLYRGDVPTDVGRILTVILVAGVIGVTAWDIADGWRKALRARRAK